MSKAPLVVFGEDWGALPTSTQHLIRRIMRERRVLWVNSIGMRSPRLNSKDFGRVINKLKAMTGLAKRPAATEFNVRLDQEVGPERIFQPKAIPFFGNRLARRMNRRLLSKGVSQVMSDMGMERPILWTSLPTAVDVVGGLNERGVAYYCGDDFGGLAGVDHEPILVMEKELARKADLIFVVGKVLAEKFPGEKTHIIPHGADVALFNREHERPADLPEGKVAGFYGSISEWLHVELLDAVAASLPDWQFVLIGNRHTDVSLLEQRDNIRFLGPRSHETLPAYSRNWSVSMLPFRDNEQIRASNPLKLREYLAAGTPVVTTDFPALDGYRDLVEIASDAASFGAALVRAGAEGRSRAGERFERVKDESWDARAKQVDDLLSRFDD